MNATFIDANSVPSTNNVNELKVQLFINVFNDYIAKQSRFGATYFSLNDAIDAIPMLNKHEFEVCVEMAKSKGWELTQFDDNYDTTSYKMQKV